jgi:hypothetical protein
MDLVSRINAHRFDDWSLNVMALQPHIDEERAELIWGGANAWYRERYAALPVAESGEILVDCAEHGLVSREFHLTKLCNGERQFLAALDAGILFPTVRLRQSIAIALRKADQELRRHDLYIFVMSGWRSPALQRIAIEWASSKFGRTSANIRFAQPQVTPHATGGACDLELYSLQTGESLTKVDDGDDISFYGPERRSGLSDAETAKRSVRRILFHALCGASAGLLPSEQLTIHPGETWHFGRGDPLSAILNGDAVAVYGPIDRKAEVINRGVVVNPTATPSGESA